MLQVIIENKYGEQLNLSNSEYYDIVSVGGITPPNATINTSIVAAQDGTMYNSSRLEQRNITLLIVPKKGIENSRINIYKYIKAKQYIKVYMKNGLRDVYIEGYVESIEADLWTKTQNIQVSIICPNPFFKAKEIKTIEFSNVVSAFEFPFYSDEIGIPISYISTFTEENVNNASDEEMGLIIHLHASGLVLRPTIYNQTTNEHFSINYEMKSGDIITINTRKGEKSLILKREGAEINIINHMEKGSKWFNLRIEDNIYSYVCEFGAENLQLRAEIQNIYVGV